MIVASPRPIPIYLFSDLSRPIAACSMTKARMLIGLHGAIMHSINGRPSLSIDVADILTAYVDPFLQLLPAVESALEERRPEYSHRAMNDREVMESMVRAACLTARVAEGLSERAIAEIRDIKMRLCDSIPGMTDPRPTSGPVADRLNNMLRIISRAQSEKKLDDMGVIRDVQALTW